mmetsp:Transcript_93123/g.267108  ORF Transcript_93123/g.267108 Transcript_93123/m.267108 type:complete len:517 (-) Transcript_93123:141-1691(-)
MLLHPVRRATASWKALQASRAVATAMQKSLEDVPGPKAWPFVGNVPDFVARVGGFEGPKGPQMTKAYHEYYKEFGSIYRIKMFGKDQQVHICNPEDIMKMFRNEGKFPPGGAENMWMIKRWAEKNKTHALDALNSRGELWRDVRFALQEDIISQKVARSYLPYINEACELASSNFAGLAAEPDVFVTRLSFDMFTSLLYGLQMKTAAGSASAEDLDFVENTKRVFHVMGLLLFNSHLKWPIFKGHKLNREFDERWTSSYEFSRKLLDRAIEASQGVPLDCKPYIARILESGKMPRSDIEQTSAALLLAGIDTTNSVINWNLLYLAANPEVQQRLRTELREVLGGGALTPEVAQEMKGKLPYLRAVVREAHRIAPPSAVLTIRTAPCDLDFEGFSVPEGTKVAMQIYSVQNDPKYVDRPESFEPERWLPEAVDARKGTEAEIIDHRLLSNPFSFGARMCLGGRAAELETYAVLCRLVQDWQFTIRKEGEESPSWKTIQPLMSKASPFPAFDVEKCNS